MARIRDHLAAFVRDDSGAASIEYGLIAAGVSLAIIIVVYQLGETVTAEYSDVDAELASQ